MSFKPQPSSFKNCVIRDCGKYPCVDVDGEYKGSDTPRCELVDCQLENSDRGVAAEHRAQITMRGGAIQNMRKNDASQAAYATNNGVIVLNGVEISDCARGVCVGEGAQCRATNLTFTNVKDEWDIFGDAGNVTHNGRQMTVDD